MRVGLSMGFEEEPRVRKSFAALRMPALDFAPMANLLPENYSVFSEASALN
jgi:hypothetical protein